MFGAEEEESLVMIEDNKIVSRDFEISDYINSVLNDAMDKSEICQKS